MTPAYADRWHRNCHKCGRGWYTTAEWKAWSMLEPTFYICPDCR